MVQELEKREAKIRITLAAARINAGYKQEDVIKMMHISKPTLISWEKGKTAPSIAQAQELCKIYRIPFDYINFG